MADKPVTPPDDVKAVLEENGKTSNYFGGEGKADGKGHGHIVSDDKGNVTYERESKNYEQNPPG